MTPDQAYEDFETIEEFEDQEFSDEAVIRSRPGRRVFVPGGLSSATLNTPRGPAKLNLPAPLATLAQFRALERVVNTHTEQLNGTRAELARVRRELALRRRDQAGMGSSGLLLTLLSQRQARDELEGHTHQGSTAAAVLPASGSSLSFMLPLLLLSPGILSGGQTASAGQPSAGQDGVSPLLLAMLFMNR